MPKLVCPAWALASASCRCLDAVRAGARVLVMGTALFGSDRPQEIMQQLREEATGL